MDNRGVSGKRRKKGGGGGGGGLLSALAAKASSNEFRRRVYKTVLYSRKTMFHVYKTISEEKLFAFVAIG